MFLRYAKTGQLPNTAESIGLGIGVAFIFWLKFTIAATFAGAGLAALIIAAKRQQMGELWLKIAWALLGFTGLSLAVIAYFALNHAVWDMIDGYFLFNALHYNASDTGKDPMPHNHLLVGGYLIGCLLLLLVPDRREVRLMVSLSVAATALLFVLVYCYSYYYIVLFIYMPLFAMAMKRWKGGWKLHLGCTLIALAALLTEYNFEMLRRHEIHSSATEMATIINADKDATVMVYDYQNAAIFIQTDCRPLIRYFFRPNSTYPAIMEEQNACLNSGRARYVVTPNVLPDSLPYERILTDYDEDRMVVPDMFARRRSFVPVHLYRHTEATEN